MKKIVVFGASGDTGRYFIKYFLENYSGDEYQIIATGTRNTDCFVDMDIPYYRVDITKKDDFNKLPKDVYAVVNLAGLMPARMKGYDPYKYIDVNIIIARIIVHILPVLEAAEYGNAGIHNVTRGLFGIYGVKILGKGYRIAIGNNEEIITG